MCVEFSQTYKKNNFFIWGRLFSSSSLNKNSIEMKTFPTLHTPRLTLGQIEVSDIPTITAYASNPNVSKMLRTMPYPYAEKDAIFWLNKARTEFKKETAYIFRIGLRDRGEFVGGVGLHLKKAHQKAVIGYWIGEPFWGKGYVTEALGAVLKFGFETLNLNKIQAVYKADNTQSGKVMIKNNMVKEGEMVDDMYQNGQFYTLIQYRLTKREYEQMSK